MGFIENSLRSRFLSLSNATATFSRNPTACRLDSSITNLRRLVTFLNTPKKHENDEDDDREAYATRRNIAPVSTV
jgi:hypothetical protein